nr:protein transport protein sec9 [Quercus suber]
MRFGRKKEDPNAPGEAERESKSGKGGLFGFRSQDKSPAQSTNPYAAPIPSQNPYAARSANANPYAAGPARRDPYSASDASLTQPPTSSFGSLSLKSEGNAPPPYTHSAQTDALRNEKSPAGPAAAPRFQTQTAHSYGAGYGGDNYGSAQPARMNGYGGMARQRSQDTLSTDAGRSALFGAAPQRLRQQASEPSKAMGLLPQSQGQDISYSNTANYGSDAMPGGYGYDVSSPDAQLQSEDDQVADIKKLIKGTRKAGIDSLSRSNNIGQQASEIGEKVLTDLMAQTDMLLNAAKNLDASHDQNIIAQGKIKDLKIANRGMLVPNFKNPLTKGVRERTEDEAALERRREQRQMQSDIQADRHAIQARQRKNDRDLDSVTRTSRAPQNSARRKDCMFEDDSENDFEDQLQEDEIQEKM